MSRARRAAGILALVVASWDLCVACRSSGLVMSLPSPRGTYLVEIRGELEKPTSVFARASELGVRALKGPEVLVEDAFFYAADVLDPSFTTRYPNQDWPSESVLRFSSVAATTAPAAPQFDVRNMSGRRMTYLKIWASGHMRQPAGDAVFLVLDLEPGSSIKLPGGFALTVFSVECAFANQKPVYAESPFDLPERDTPYVIDIGPAGIELR